MCSSFIESARCLLIVSSGLRLHLEKLLAGLMDVDEQKQWTFETFFKESKSLTCRLPLHFLSVFTATAERLYLNPLVFSLWLDPDGYGSEGI